MKQFYKVLLFLFAFISVSFIFGRSIDQNSWSPIQLLNFLVNSEPPELTSSQTELCGPGSVTLTTTGDGHFEWYNSNTEENLGSGTDNQLVLTVTETSTYHVVLDPEGENKKSNEVQIVVNDPPVVSFTTTQTVLNSGEEINFNPTVSYGTGPYKYNWNFGDGNTSTEANPSHEYSTFGCGTTTFTVSLTVIDDNGCQDTVSQELIVNEQPVVDLNDVDKPFAPEPFNNCGNASVSSQAYTINADLGSESDLCATYQISWGDGTPTINDVSFPIAHTYSELGVYELTVTAVGSNGTITTKVYQVKNISNPAGGLTSPGNTSGLCAPTEPLGFAITNWKDNSPGTTYTVDYGDGTPPLKFEHPLNATGEDFPVPHVYERSNCPSPEYTVTLTVENACDKTDFTLNSIKILEKPTAKFSTEPIACTNTNTLFNNESISGFNTGCSTMTVYKWDFGDGTQIESGYVSSPQSVSHQYSSPGTYLVSLTASSQCGEDTFTQEICVEAAPNPDFELNATEICTGEILLATNISNFIETCEPEFYWSISATGSNWSYEDGTSPTDQDANFIFHSPGIYQIVLQESNSCGTVTTSKTITVKAKPVVDIADIGNLCAASEVQISPEITTLDPADPEYTYVWSFPGGTPSSSTEARPTVIYTSPGTHTFTVDVTNSCGTTTSEKTFVINPPLIANAGEDVTICEGDVTQLSAQASGGNGSGYSYSWSPLTGINDPYSPNPVVSPSQTTTYYLTVSDGTSCSTVDSVTVYVNSLSPGTISSTQTLCSGDTPQTLQDLAPATGEGALSYQWQHSSDNINFTDIEDETAVEYNPPVVTETTYYRRITTSTLNGVECSEVGNSVAIFVNNVSPGSFIQDVTICTGGDVSYLTPQTSASGSGTLTYIWEQSTDNINFSEVGTGPSFDPPSLSETTYFRRKVSSTLNGSVCTALENIITITVVPDPVISEQPLATQTLCEGGTAESLTVEASGGTGSLSYQWYVSSTESNSGGTLLSGATDSTYIPSSATAGIQYYYAVITGEGLGCQTKSSPAKVEILASPSFTLHPVSEELCIGEEPAQLIVEYQNGMGNPDYQWYSYTEGEPPIAIQGANSATYLPSSAEVGSTNYFVVLTFGTGGCSTITSEEARITVNTYPEIRNKEQVICSGTTFSVIPVTSSEDSVPAGTTYTWSAPTGNGFTGGYAQPTPQPEISQTLTNTTNHPVTATYTVTPMANGCEGNSFQIKIKIEPTPIIPDQQVTVCPGESFLIDPKDNEPSTTVPGNTTYTWEAPLVTGGLSGGTSGSGASVSGELTNPTNEAQTATYTVIPVSGNCQGDPFLVVVTVSPEPVIADHQISTCSEELFSFTPEILSSNLVPSNTTYTWSKPVISPAGSLEGSSAESTGKENISQTLTNTTNDVATATYTVVPTAGNCIGDPFQLVVTVQPDPTMEAVQDLVLCGGEPAAFDFSSSAVDIVYHWTNDTPAIGLPSSGTGDIAEFTVTNTGKEPLVATIEVIPQVGSCTGTPEVFTLTVNPAPNIIFSGADQVICSSTESSEIILSSETPSTSITWTAIPPDGITGVETSGTNIIPAQLLVNHTNNPITVQYIAQASTEGVSCPGPETIYSITVDPVPFVKDDITTLSCSGQAIVINPADYPDNYLPTGTTYTWTAPTGNGFSGGTAQNTGQDTFSQRLTNDTDTPVTAEYEVTPTFKGCVGEAFIIQITLNPAAEISDSRLDLCHGGSFAKDFTEEATILPTGTTFSWDAPIVTGGITGATAGSGESFSGTLFNTSSTPQTATYTITPISPIEDCVGKPFTVVVTVYPQFQVSSVVSNYNGFEISSAGGSDGSINLIPSGGSGTYEYTWTGPDGFTSSSQNLSGLKQGTYEVIISDGLCANQELIFELREPVPFIISEVVESRMHVICHGDTTGAIEVAIVQVSVPPFDYILYNADGTVVSSEMDTTAENHTFENLPAGLYTVEVIDSNDTSKTISDIEIQEPENPLTITTSVLSEFNGFNISCYGARDGAIDLSVEGGTPGYTFSWTGPDGFSANTEDISGLEPGTYSVEITDNTGICLLTQDYIITEPDPLTLSHTMSDYNGYGISCRGASDGFITLFPSGGTLEYQYEWTGPDGFTSSAKNLDGLPAGTYNLLLSDSNGCVLEVETFILEEPDSLTLSETHTDVVCFGDATGSIDILVSGGTPGSGSAAGNQYVYSWTGPGGFTANTEDLQNLIAGDYHLKVTDSNGCSSEISVLLNQQPEILVTSTTTEISCYGANDASISLDITGGNPPYIVTWDNLATGTYQDNLGAGNHLITITDASNCVKEVEVHIQEAPVFKIEPVVENVSCNGAADGSITLNLTGGEKPILLTWSDGSTAGTTRNNLKPGSYSVQISDGSSCHIEETFIITEPNPFTVQGTVTHATDCDDAQSGVINLIPSGGSPPYQYSWSNGSTSEDLIGVTEGSYSVKVIDAEGCSASAQFVVERQEPLSVTALPEVVVDCETQSVRQLHIASATGGIPPYEYSWTSGQTSGVSNEQMETAQNGTVIVTATDKMGCTASYMLEVDIQLLGSASFTTSSYSMDTYGIFSVHDPIEFTNTSTGDYLNVSWNFGDGTVSTEENPTHTFINAGTHQVTQTITYPYGCITSITYTIEIDQGYNIMLPNAFTPNEDGMNDYFKPEHRGLKHVEMSVYDTWGNLLYKENGEKLTGWNGILKGNPSENGNYYYKVTGETFYGHIVSFDGAFTLIR